MNKVDIDKRNFDTSPELNGLFINLYGRNPKKPIENSKVLSITNLLERSEINWKRNAETGKCFRNMRFDWWFLSDYIYQFTNIFNKKDKELFFSKRIKFISEEKAFLLSVDLQNLINTGHTLKYWQDFQPIKNIQEIDENGKKIYKIKIFKFFSVENVQYFTTFCKNSGGFRIN